MEKLIYTLTLFFIYTFISFGSTDPLDFLAMFGARPLGLGQAYVAVADSPEAILLNPAGLSQLSSPQFTSMYANAFNEAKYFSAFYVQPLSPFSAFGIGMAQVGVGDNDYLDSSGNRLGGFDYLEQGLFLAYSQNFNSRLSFGTTLKYIQKKALADHSAIALDLGLLYQQDQLKLALSIDNIATTLLGSDRLLIQYKVGAAWTSFDFLFSEEVRYQAEQLYLYSGVEYELFQLLALRAGLSNNHLNLGVGLFWQNFKVDMSWSAVDLEDIYRLSLSYGSS